MGWLKHRNEHPPAINSQERGVAVNIRLLVLAVTIFITTNC
ncbi:11316_t:CDS:2 [Paraglomus occultum]|uniref:11316_t:CDS:1 n=1 Tax=Paraglomus occultum TaxID=144539 RepID=A0A9N9FBI7_9GLOM|nr:11316_t:CDS:2 [Paraglomus occultum]